jgi:hypothetical protein
MVTVCYAAIPSPDHPQNPSPLQCLLLAVLFTKNSHRSSLFLDLGIIRQDNAHLDSLSEEQFASQGNASPPETTPGS